MSTATPALPNWTIALPLLAWGLLAGQSAGMAGGMYIALMAVGLVAAGLARRRLKADQA